MDIKKNLSHAEEKAQVERDYHDHNLSDLAELNKVLFTAIETLEQNSIPYALIGGVAAKSLGRPRVTHDIDLFVRPDDADRVLEVLEGKGFSTQKRDPFWLFKAWSDEILVDVIFKSSGDIYFDEEVRSHVRRVPYLHSYVNAISPEDFLVIKAAAHQEHNPHHWHDALAVLKQGNLDWEYLLKRAKHAPRRILALLIYGQSNDIAVPNEVIQKLYRGVFESPVYTPESIIYPYRHDLTHMMTTTSEEGTESPIYVKGKIMEALTTDERIAEHDVKVVVSDKTIVAKGEVFTEEQKEAVDEVIREMAPNYECKNLVNVRILHAPEGSEAIK
ncbi:nucleotidyltransferase [Peredibacter sp. HCB2-198]|uniref:nucleotidyltransferase n=1 Tax=Peredibacter sp. HCB2-198 TaxID=3383025 RepID=UPI0038B44FF6